MGRSSFEDKQPAVSAGSDQPGSAEKNGQSHQQELFGQPGATQAPQRWQVVCRIAVDKSGCCGHLRCAERGPASLVFAAASVPRTGAQGKMNRMQRKARASAGSDLVRNCEDDVPSGALAWGGESWCAHSFANSAIEDAANSARTSGTGEFF